VLIVKIYRLNPLDSKNLKFSFARRNCSKTERQARLFYVYDSFALRPMERLKIVRVSEAFQTRYFWNLRRKSDVFRFLASPRIRGGFSGGANTFVLSAARSVKDAPINTEPRALDDLTSSAPLDNQYVRYQGLNRKPAVMFSLNATTADGVSHYCRRC